MEEPEERIARELQLRIKRQFKKVQKARDSLHAEEEFLAKLRKRANCDHVWECTGDFMYIISTCTNCGLQDSV